MATWNSRGLRGSTLEELINRSNEQYREKGLALIQKVPTPITPVRIAKDTRQITLAYFEQKSTVDYIGAVCGRWDLNPHEHTPTRSLVLPVCQFQHSRALSLSERQVILYPRKTEKSTLFLKNYAKN